MAVKIKLTEDERTMILALLSTDDYIDEVAAKCDLRAATFNFRTGKLRKRLGALNTDHLMFIGLVEMGVLKKGPLTKPQLTKILSNQTDKPYADVYTKISLAYLDGLTIGKMEERVGFSASRLYHFSNCMCGIYQCNTLRLAVLRHLLAIGYYILKE